MTTTKIDNRKSISKGIPRIAIILFTVEIKQVMSRCRSINKYKKYGVKFSLNLYLRIFAYDLMMLFTRQIQPCLNKSSINLL